MRDGADETKHEGYTRRLVSLEALWWKRFFNVQAPYRWNLRRLGLGRTLEVGCGIGRNLAHLGEQAVGIDHNAASVAIAKDRGLLAFTPDEFRTNDFSRPGAFDSLLLAHVIEHMSGDEAISVVSDHLRYVRRGGKLVLITPQEAGYRSDPSHVRFVDFAGLAALCVSVGTQVVRMFSFPFPRFFGRVFRYNEFVLVARLPD